MSDSSDDPPPIIVRNATSLQRLKLEKLMKNPEKPVLIPERQKERKLPHVPDFVRNVMGSSAGAGSGEFHVYRHLRRKEYARQKYIQERGQKILRDEAYQRKLEDNKKAAEEKTAKKRAKRLKKKENLKKKKRMLKTKQKNENDMKKSESEFSDSEDDDNDDDGDDDSDITKPKEENGDQERLTAEKTDKDIDSIWTDKLPAGEPKDKKAEEPSNTTEKNEFHKEEETNTEMEVDEQTAVCQNQEN